MTAVSLAVRGEGRDGEQMVKNIRFDIIVVYETACVLHSVTLAAHLSLNELECHTESGETLHFSHHLLILEIRGPFVFQSLQGRRYFFIKNLYTNTTHESVKRQPDCPAPSRLTTSISFNLLSFFSMVLWADALLLSYILVPAASSIIDSIWNNRRIIKWLESNRHNL